MRMNGWSAFRCDAVEVRAGRMRCDSDNIGPLHPRLCREKSLAKAGDVGFSTRGSHYALSSAARNVVIYLRTCRTKPKHILT